MITPEAWIYYSNSKDRTIWNQRGFEQNNDEREILWYNSHRYERDQGEPKIKRHQA